MGSRDAGEIENGEGLAARSRVESRAGQGMAERSAQVGLGEAVDLC
jgi:hypothetical protein